MVHVFIVGSKGIPARYGGFETFVEELTARKNSQEIQYHVSCMGDDGRNFMHNGAECFNVPTPLPGAPGRIFHVALALRKTLAWSQKHNSERIIVYILGCRIGPLLIPLAHQLRERGIKIYCNPDGLEWKRDKWNRLEKQFLRICEKSLVENSDLAICDSKGIEQYLLDTYGNRCPQTTYIAYGAEVTEHLPEDEDLLKWLGQYGAKPEGYYLIVGRFVPENNYETMIREFMKSKTKRSLFIISNVEQNAFYQTLASNTGFENDPRIRFVGTIYDHALLTAIRQNAYAYIHGHEVGGTNPSLLEALSSTKVNLVLDVIFNREVGQNAVCYWSKSPGTLADLINKVDTMPEEERKHMGTNAKKRILSAYHWDKIVADYETLFLRDGTV